MRSTWHRGLLVLLLLSLAGCFQQAGESLQSTGSTAVPFTSDDLSSPTADLILPADSDEIATEMLDAESNGEATEEVPRMEIITATPLPALNQPTTATLPPITIIVQPTNGPDSAVSTEPAESASLENAEDADATPASFITPGLPLGPGLDMDTPTPAGGALPAITPSGSGLVTPTALSRASVSEECTYTVARGDTVYRIALSHNTTVAAMREVNPDLVGENPVIQPGQVLILPECDEDDDEPAAEETEPVETATEIPSVIEPAMPGTATTAAAPGQQETYVVQRGDTLFTIAQRFGTTVAALVAANNLQDPNRLSLGQELIIPQR